MKKLRFNIAESDDFFSRGKRDDKTYYVYEYASNGLCIAGCGAGYYSAYNARRSIRRMVEQRMDALESPLHIDYVMQYRVCIKVVKP